MATEQIVSTMERSMKFSNVHNLCIDVRFDGTAVHIERSRDDGEPLPEKKILFDGWQYVYVELPKQYINFNDGGHYHYVGLSDCFDVKIEKYLNDGTGLKIRLENFRQS